MELTQDAASHVAFQIAEDGEAIGTVQQFADQLHLPRPLVYTCLEASDSIPVVLGDEQGEDPLLIVDADGVDALIDCAAETIL